MKFSLDKKLKKVKIGNQINNINSSVLIQGNLFHLLGILMTNLINN